MTNCFVEGHLRRIPTFDGAQIELVKLVRSSLTAVRPHLIFHFHVLILASSSYYTCATCSSRSCFKCKMPAHVNLSCDQAKVNRIRREHNGEEVASTTWLGANTKECYTCHRQCHKEIGCDHITCICGAEWCWLCGAKYIDIRKVGNTAHQRKCKHYR
jgi:hypothetical protein